MGLKYVYVLVLGYKLLWVVSVEMRDSVCVYVCERGCSVTVTLHVRSYVRKGDIHLRFNRYILTGHK